MMETKKLAILLMLSFFVLEKLESQECSGCFFSAATLFVQNDADLVEKIKALFPKLTHRKKAINLRVDTRIEYIPLYNAFGANEQQVLIDSLTQRAPTVSPLDYDTAKRFESYEIPELERLSSTPDAALTLRFSHCETNYLVAEVLDGRMNYGRTRYGKVLHILFIFNKRGYLTKSITSSYTYN